MKRVIVFVVSLTLCITAKAQVNIFLGGIRAGHSSFTLLPNVVNSNMFSGGVSDGHASFILPVANANSNIYLGGNGDGHSSMGLPFSIGSSSFYGGGVNDGHASIILLLAVDNSNIFPGGNHDGHTSVVLPVLIDNSSIFTGGFNDGHSSASLNFIIPTVTITSQTSDTFCIGSDATFIATPFDGGDNPIYQWYHNDVLVGTGNDTIILSGFANGDSLYCKLISSLPNAFPDTVQSNTIYITVKTPQIWYADADGDGFGNGATTIFDCNQPAAYVANNTDCDDNNPTIFPGAITVNDSRPFRCRQSGDWSQPSTWQHFDGCSWIDGGVPDHHDGVITIGNNYTVTVTSAGVVTADQLVLEDFGELDINSRLTLMDGPGTDMFIDVNGGGLTINSGGILSGAGTVVNEGRIALYGQVVTAAKIINNGYTTFMHSYAGCCTSGVWNMTDGITTGSFDNYDLTIFFEAEGGVNNYNVINGRFHNHAGAETKVLFNTNFDVNEFVNESEFFVGSQVFESQPVTCTIKSTMDATHHGRFKSNGYLGKFIIQPNATYTYAADCNLDWDVNFASGTHEIYSTNYGSYNTTINTTVNFYTPEMYFSGNIAQGGGVFGGPAVKRIGEDFSWWGGTVSGGNLIIDDTARLHLGAGQISLGTLATTLINNGATDVSTGYGGCCTEPAFTMTNGIIENNAQFIFNTNGGGGVRNLTFIGGTFNNNLTGTLINNAQASSGYGDNATYLRTNVLSNNGTILNNGVSLNIFPTSNAILDGTITTAAGSQTRVGNPATTITFGASSVIDGPGAVIFRQGSHQVNSLHYNAGSTQIGEGNTTAEVYFNMPSVNLNNISVSNSIMGGNAAKLLKDDLFIVNGEISGGPVTNTDTSSVVFYNINRLKTSFTSNNFTGIYADYGGCCSGGSLDLSNGGSFVNNGLIDLTGYGGIQQMGIDNGNFVNNGTMNIHFSAYGNITRIKPATFTNNGTINHQLGRLELNTFTIGGIINTSAGTEMASTGIITFNGSLINNNGNILAPFNFITAPAKVLKGTGTFSNTTVLDNTTTVTPGSSPGILTIAGNYVQGGATLTIELGGTNPGTEHDRLAITGSATLSGILNASQINGFDPQSFTSIDVLTASSVTGTFSQVNLPAFWSVKYFSNKVSLVKFFENVYYRDADGDGFGNLNDSIHRYETTAPAGYTRDNTDCNDNNAAVNPSATEVCDGIDNNCDGIVDTVFMEGLVLYMPLDGNAIDKSVNALNGTINGSVVAGTDRFGNPSGAMVFNGNQNNHIRINDNPLLRPSSITLSAWVYIAAQRSPSGFITKSINCYNDSWHFGTEGSSYSTWVSNSTNCGDFVQMTSPYTERVWKHVVYTLDAVADIRKMYVDGTLVASGVYTSSIPYDGNPVLIGAAIESGALDFPFIGSLDDVMIFNRAITAAEVSHLFINGSPLTALSTRYYTDADGDGFGNPAVSQVACSQPTGYVLNNTDCDDTHNTVYPGAPEICDGLDNDCNGYTDTIGTIGFVCATANENGALTITAPEGLTFSSVDFASYGNPNGECGSFSIGTCHAASSLSIVQGLVIGQHSATIPASNGLFGDPCGGTQKRLYVQARYSTLQPLTQIFYADADGDGYGNPASTIIGICGGIAPPGYISNSSDCDDNNANINPGVSPGIILGSTTFCVGSANTFTATGTAGGTWISRNTNVATVDGNGLVTAVGNGTTRIVYLINDCTAEGRTDSLFINVATQYVWTGAGADSNWNNAANWTACGIPVSGEDVTINDVVNKPSLNVDVTTGALTLNGNASIALNDKILTINGAVTGTGTLSSSPSSSLIIAGNAGSMKFTVGKDTIKNITLLQNASATIGNMLYVKAGTQPGVITLQQGSVLNANGNLTLLSDIGGTARVAQIPVNGTGTALASVNGDVVVERFIPKNTYKAWQLLSIPTKGNQTIKQAWQENQNANAVGTTGYGTLITTAAGYIQNGFDAVTAKTSMQSFNAATGGLVNVTSTLTPAESKNGYFLFVRGDRSVPVTGNNNAVNMTKLRTKGVLYTGNQAPLSSAANRNLMVGNIYPSAIDFTLLPKTGGIGNILYIWDPKLNNGTTLGAYQTFSAINGYAPTVSGGSYNGPNTRIESGQSFFVNATGTAGSIQMVEAAKVDGNNFNVFRPMARQAEISVKLLANVNGEWFTADGNIIAFDQWFTNATNSHDAPKMLNPGENIASVNSDRLFAVEARGTIGEQESVRYHISNLRQQQYQLQFDFKAVAGEGREVYLEDSYLKTSSLIDCNLKANYIFTVNSDAASGHADRFMLSFNQKRSNLISTASEQKISVGPNPSDGHYFNLNLYSFSKGLYKMKLLGQKGELLYVYSGDALEGNSSVKIILENKPAAGIYTVELVDVNNRHFTDRIIFR